MPILKKTYPGAKTALNFANPLELLIATILSAQCTDVRVNMVTKDLYKKYKSAHDWANADIKQIESDIKSTGFYHNKALSIKKSCAEIIKQFGGKVPDTMEELVKLPGVGRKTANVVLGNVFGQPAIACDTHVIRLSRRLGFIGKQRPCKTGVRPCRNCAEEGMDIVQSSSDFPRQADLPGSSPGLPSLSDFEILSRGV